MKKLLCYRIIKLLFLLVILSIVSVLEICFSPTIRPCPFAEIPSEAYNTKTKHLYTPKQLGERLLVFYVSLLH